MSATETKHVHYFQRALDAAYDFCGKLEPKIRRLAAIGLAIVATVAAFWLLEKIIFYYLATSYVDQIGKAYDLNKNPVTALVIVTFLVAAAAVPVGIGTLGT